VLSRWSRAGAVAAALTAAIAGTVWMQHRAAEARVAYETMLAEPPVYSMELAPDGYAGAAAERVPSPALP
jgi:hypothetical protein